MGIVHASKWLTGIALLSAAAGQPVPSLLPDDESALFGMMTEAEWDEFLRAWTPGTTTTLAPTTGPPATAATPPVYLPKPTGKHPRSDNPTGPTRWTPADFPLTKVCLEILLGDLWMSERDYIAAVRSRMPSRSTEDVLDMRVSLVKRSIVRDSTHATLSLFAVPKTLADLAVIVERVEEEYAREHQTPPVHLPIKLLTWYKYCIKPLRAMRSGDELPCGPLRAVRPVDELVSGGDHTGYMILSDFQTKRMFTDFLRRLEGGVPRIEAVAMPRLNPPAKQPRLAGVESVGVPSVRPVSTTPIPDRPQGPALDAEDAQYGMSRDMKSLILRLMAEDPLVFRGDLFAMVKAIFTRAEASKVWRFEEFVRGHASMVDWWHLFLQKHMDMIPDRVDELAAASAQEFLKRRLTVPSSLAKRISIWHALCLAPLALSDPSGARPCAPGGSGFFRLSAEQSKKLFNSFAV